MHRQNLCAKFELIISKRAVDYIAEYFCGKFELINYNDKEAIKQSCATANSSTLAYLPVLGEGEAILTGVDFPMPLLLKMTAPIKKPDSATPKFKG